MRNPIRIVKPTKDPVPTGWQTIALICPSCSETLLTKASVEPREGEGIVLYDTLINDSATAWLTEHDKVCLTKDTMKIVAPVPRNLITWIEN